MSTDRSSRGRTSYQADATAYKLSSYQAIKLADTACRRRRRQKGGEECGRSKQTSPGDIWDIGRGALPHPNSPHRDTHAPQGAHNDAGGDEGGDTGTSGAVWVRRPSLVGIFNSQFCNFHSRRNIQCYKIQTLHTQPTNPRGPPHTYCLNRTRKEKNSATNCEMCFVFAYFKI